MALNIDQCKTLLKQYNQEHLLRFWEELDESQRAQLLGSIQEIDFAKVNSYWAECLPELSGKVIKVDERLQPVPEEICGSILQCSEDELSRYFDIGLEQIANNRVACLLLAGGQGTRLGVTYPKGLYKVDLPSGKSLYEIQADRIKKVCSLASARFGKACSVPWYIMTSEHTQDETQRFFENHAYFGIDPQLVCMFEQYTLPALTRDGKCILETRSRVSTAPDGNGGLYRALAHHSIVENMKERGVQYVFVYCVDNILVKMADPHFIGFAVHRNAECANKVVEKTEPNEAVGVVGMVDGRYSVIEYSEITLDTASKRRDNNGLLFNAGNICNHFFTTDFLQRIIREHSESLRHHVAFKKVPHVDEHGTLIKPSVPNGVKLEKFVFDVFPFVRDGRFAVWQVRREDEFAPLKNADAPRVCVSDSPSTCRAALFYFHSRLLLQAGASIAYRTARNRQTFCAGAGAESTNQPGDNAKDEKSSQWKIADRETLCDLGALRKLCESNTIAVELDATVTYFGEALESFLGHLITSPSFIDKSYTSALL